MTVELQSGCNVRTISPLRELKQQQINRFTERDKQHLVTNRRANAVGMVGEQIPGMGADMFVVHHYDEEPIGETPKFNGASGAYFHDELIYQF